MACCLSMVSAISKIPNAAKRAVNYVTSWFGNVSTTTSRVGSMDPSKNDAENKCNGSQANGHAPNQTGQLVQSRTRSLDSTKIANWEPDAAEKELIKLTWSDEFNFLYELGSNIYVYIFQHNPETRKLFPAIHQHGENYKDSREFRSQALKFVQTLSHAVKNLYHMNDLAPHLYKIGQRHVKFADRGFQPDYWDIFLDAMEEVLSNKIASIEQFDEEQRQRATSVWRRLAFYIITHMKHGYFDELKNQQEQNS